MSKYSDKTFEKILDDMCRREKECSKKNKWNGVYYCNKSDTVLRNKTKNRTFYRIIFIILFIEKVVLFCYYNI